MKLFFIRAVIGIFVLFVCTYSNQAQGKFASVLSKDASLRDAPSWLAEPGRKLIHGSVVKILDQEGIWLVVRQGNYVGWIHSELLSFEKAMLSEGQSLNPNKDLSDINSNAVDPGKKPLSIESKGTINRSPTAGKTYYRGPRGGCYYISPNGRKSYVDRSLCN